MTPTTGDPAVSAQEFEFAPLEYARNYRRALVAEFSPFLHGNVLEVGAGVGHITALLNIVPTVKRVVALEPETQFRERLSRIIPSNCVVHGTISDVRENGWNAIVCVNVLEHIENDVHELRAYRARLQEEHGCLCLFVPARQELYAPIDRDFGHYRRYDKPNLAEKLQRAGFETVRLTYFNSVGYFIWWLNFKVVKHRRFEPAKIVVFDRFIFPLIHAAESKLVRPPFGQSLLAVARA
jgi:hypothetical protein